MIKHNSGAYSAPGTKRNPMNSNLVRKVITIYGTQWFLETIMNIVCTITKVKASDIYSKTRKREVILVRHLLRYYGWELLNSSVSLRQVSMFVSNGRTRDHSIVINSREVIKEAIEGRDEWASSILNYMHEIDFQLNQITVHESNSNNG